MTKDKYAHVVCTITTEAASEEGSVSIKVELRVQEFATIGRSGISRLADVWRTAKEGSYEKSTVQSDVQKVLIEAAQELVDNYTSANSPGGTAPATGAGPAVEPRVVFESYRDGNREIYVMNTVTKNVTRITNNTFDDRNPKFSSEGSTILFESSRDGNSEIYAMNDDGTGQLRMTNNAARDIMPALSPDGTKIAWTST